MMIADWFQSFMPTPFLMYLVGHERIKHRILGQDSPLRVLAFGGEPCPSLSILQKWKHPKCTTRLFNLYGITEVSSWASCFEIIDKELQNKKSIDHAKNTAIEDEVMSLNIIEENAPLGTPLDDTILEVRDDNGLKLDEGVGRIFIGGENRVCYVNSETSFQPGTIRPTGDIGYIKENRIWYIGRKNRNIKRQAKQVNLDWLEQTISKTFPNFIICAVSDVFSTGLQDKIYLFVKPESSYNERLFLTSLRKEISKSFPLYAQPDYISVVEAIPMTSHGKVDTKVLVRTCREESLIRKPVKIILETLWLKEFVKIEDDPDGPPCSNGNTQDLPPRVKREDMFVEHGGNSLAALRLANEIKAWFHQNVDSQAGEMTELVDIILNNSFGKLCEYIQARILGKGYTDTEKTIEQVVELGSLGSAVTESNSHDISSVLFAKDEDSSPLISQNFDLGKIHQNRNLVDCKEVKPPVSPKRRKTEVPSKHTLQSEATTDLTNCFCSIQRGMRTSICPFCIKSNMVHYQDVSISESFRTAIVFKWKCSFHKCIDASPLVVGTNGKDPAVVYLGSHDYIFKAVYLSSGMDVWETRLGDRIESSAALSKCGRYVIVGCYDGKIYTLNRRDGKFIWTFQTGGPVKSSPYVDPSTGLVWVGSHDHSLYTLDVNKGNCISSIDCGSSCFSSPWILEEPHLVFIGTLGGRIVSVNASTHSIKWNHQCPKPIFSSPMATSQGVTYACVDGSVYRCDLDGNPVWEFKTTGPVFSSPTMFLSSSAKGYTDCTLFGSHDGFLYCVLNSGELRWKFATDSQVYSTPFVAQYVAVSGEEDCPNFQVDIPATTLLPKQGSEKTFLVKSCNDPIVVVCSTRGTLYCISLNHGSLVSSWSFPGQVFSSPVVIGNVILVGCRDDFLYCLTTNPSHQRQTCTA